MENSNNVNFIDLRETAGTYEGVSSHSEDLLMYLAKRNIRFRHGLLMHIIAWVASAIFLVYLTNYPYRISGYYGRFLEGIYFAWAVFIAYKVVVLVRHYIHSRSGVRKDPVKAEYNRLRSTSPEKIAQEMKQL